jgi:hypothetical protein
MPYKRLRTTNNKDRGTPQRRSSIAHSNRKHRSNTVHNSRKLTPQRSRNTAHSNLKRNPQRRSGSTVHSNLRLTPQRSRSNTAHSSRKIAPRNKEGRATPSSVRSNNQTSHRSNEHNLAMIRRSNNLRGERNSNLSRRAATTTFIVRRNSST